MKAKSAAAFLAAGIAVAVLYALAGAAAIAAPLSGNARGGAASYARMAPVDEYLISDPRAEIALARSAAPQAISARATVLVLKPHGYEMAAQGSNGFTCLVERGWDSPFDSPEFWNPKMRAPVCYNPAASRSILLYRLARTKLALAGHSREEMLAETRGALARRELPAAPEPGAMSFMMSKQGYLGDAQGHWHSHLMFHVPKAAAATWGANLPGSPVLLDVREVPEPESIFLVPVDHWSDGTAAPVS
jgi:hypothetical protein